MKPIVKRILTAISGSESSINAAKYAILLAKQLNFELFVLYVVDTSTLNDLLTSRIFIQEESTNFEHHLRANGNRYLSYVETLAQEKKIKISKILKQGNIATTILETAEEEKCDLIILGGWEINRSKRDLISRSHMEVLMDSKRTVMIVKESDIDNLFKKS